MGTRAWQLAIAAVGLVAAGPVVASAVPVDAAACDSDGVVVHPRAALGASGAVEVTAVDLTGIAAACTGGTVAVVLNGAARQPLATTRPAPVTGSDLTIAVRGVRADRVTSVSVVIDR